MSEIVLTPSESTTKRGGKFRATFSCKEFAAMFTADNKLHVVANPQKQNSLFLAFKGKDNKQYTGAIAGGTKESFDTIASPVISIIETAEGKQFPCYHNEGAQSVEAVLDFNQ